MTERTCMWAPDAKHCLCCTQQQVIEADTVSRAEHERAVAELRATLSASYLPSEWEKLRAELAAERARAEEAESDHRRVTQAFSDAAAELAAANARAGRLEDSLAKVMAAVRLTPDKLEEAMRQGQAALSTAPQASTEQASPSPAVGEDWSSPGDLAPAPFRKAQPAPGGTEQNHHCDSCGGRLPSQEWRYSVALGNRDRKLFCCLSCKQRWCTLDVFHGRDPRDGQLYYRTREDWIKLGVTRDEPPAEPQGRPEQAGDRVEPDLVAARRCFRAANADYRHDIEAASDAMCAAIGHILNHLEQLRLEGK